MSEEQLTPIVKDDGPLMITRREALRRGAKIGGAVWVVPVVNTLGMSAAQAKGNTPAVTGVETTETTETSERSGKRR